VLKQTIVHTVGFASDLVFQPCTFACAHTFVHANPMGHALLLMSLSVC